MAFSRVAVLRKALCAPTIQTRAAIVTGHGRWRYFCDGPKDSEDAAPETPEPEPSGEEEAPKPRTDHARAYSEYLRGIMTAKYLSKQPVALPHPLNKKIPEGLSMEEQRLLYARRVSALRKKYAMEVQKKKAAKEAFAKQEKQKLLVAKEERLRIKKEKSAQRASEVAEEMRILQAKLASEREERQAHRKQKDIRLEERRLKERDIIRQQSGRWIEEKNLESRVLDALEKPIRI